MRLFILLLFLLGSISAQGRDFLPNAQRILFLGDSITHGGQYVDGFEGYLFAAYPERQWQVINVGLSSETVSGLSEEGHVGGKFPRPDVHERLERVLAKTKPDVVFVCYGMNDGIYLPLEEGRFASFRAGMEKLHAKVVAAGARVIHLTPPVFDAVALSGRTSADGIGGPFEGYDDVLTKYSEWLLAQQQAQGWKVIDLHGPMRAALDAQRSKEPGFRFANDGVHPSHEGHWLMTRALVRNLEGETVTPLLDRLLSSEPPVSEYLELIRKRGQLLNSAWLTETGHTRPGVGAGLPLAQAEEKAAALEKRIREFVIAHPALIASPVSP